MSQGNKTIDIRAWVIRILKNWYWFALSCVLMSVIGILSYNSSNKEYVVDAKLMLRSNDSKNMMPQADLLALLGVNGSKSIQTELEILTSRDLITQVIQELDLQTEYRKKVGMKWMGQYPKRDMSVVYAPEFLDSMKYSAYITIKVRRKDYVVKVKYGKFNTSRHKVKDLTQPFETCAATLCFDLHNADAIRVGDCYRFKTTPRLPLVNSYHRKITASAVSKESDVIHISTVTDMPIRAHDFINKQIELYNMDAVMDKNIMASNTAAFIDERLALIESELAEAEQNEVNYQERHGIIDLPTEAEIFLMENAEYRKKLTEVETQLNLVQFVSDFVKDESNVGKLIPANLGITDETLISLITEYNVLMLRRMRVERTAGASNPVLNQMNKQLASMRENVIATMSSVRETLLIAKNDLDTHFNMADKWRGNVPTQVKQYREVVRTKEMKEKLYLFLFEKREENALRLASAVMPAKVIATPQMNPNPVNPSMKLYVLICLIFGMAIPFGCMLVYDVMNNRLSSDAKDLERRLNIPLGGMLVQNHRGEHIAVRDGENSVSAELFRTLRTNIRFMQPVDTACPVMLVTSSINGEGKSYVATNLAISMALLGKKVALVGLDIRKPMLAHYLQLPSQGCLTSYLADSAYDIGDVIVPTNIKNLDALPAGIIPPNPSELLQSDRLTILFEELRKRYDCVIVDSAPVAMVSDTFLLNRMADMTIYVTRANYTTFDLIDFLNQTHAQERLPRMVAVLNGVDAKQVGYGYGYGYGQNVKSGKKNR